MYFLDTNICVYFLSDKFSHIKEKMTQISQKDISLPVIVMAELYYGAAKSERKEHNLERYFRFISLYDIVSFDNKAAQAYGDIRAALEAKGLPIGGNDLLIAASALANNAVLVTNNVREFSRVNGLIIEDWTHA
jgi:tRNA(fMet)-specific endonuclease VapC